MTAADARPFPYAELREPRPTRLSRRAVDALAAIRTVYRADPSAVDVAFDLDALAQSEVHNERDPDDWLTVQSPWSSDPILDLRANGYSRGIRYLAGCERFSPGALNVAHAVMLVAERESAAAGMLRPGENYVGRRGTSFEEAAFVPPPPQEVAADLAAFSAWTETATAADVVRALATCDAWLVWTHPYIDGNGRISVGATSALAIRLFDLRGPLLMTDVYMRSRPWRDPLLRALPDTFASFVEYYRVVVSRAIVRTAFVLRERAAAIDTLVERDADRSDATRLVDAVLLQPQGTAAALAWNPAFAVAASAPEGIVTLASGLYRSPWAVRRLRMHGAI